MTTSTHRYLRHGRAGRLASAVGAMALVPILCAANPRAIVQPDTGVATVSVADLDLSKPDGARIARRRLEVAAIRLCRGFSDSRRVADFATLADCSRDAVADALRHVNSLNALASGAQRATPTRY